MSTFGATAIERSVELLRGTVHSRSGNVRLFLRAQESSKVLHARTLTTLS